MPLARFPGGDLSSDATDVLVRLQDAIDLGGRFHEKSWHTKLIIRIQS